MTQEANLHGGPMHGQKRSIQDGQSLITIRQPKHLAAGFETYSEAAPTEIIQYRQGTYSRVRHTDTDFEWDGWKP